MGHYLYGLLAPPARGTLAQMQAAAAGVTSLGGPVALSAVEGMLLVHCPCDLAEISQTRRNMLAHTRMLEALMPLATCLPVRFGVIAQDLAEVARMIHERRAELVGHAQRLLDHVEIGLRVRFPRDRALAQLMAETPDFVAERDRLMGQGAGAHFARADFGRRLAEALDARRTRDQKRLLAALRPHVRDHVLRAPEEDVEVLRAEFLIPAAGSTPFRASRMIWPRRWALRAPPNRSCR
ncbi:GvpL/GvpF family gas vesicle protein [Rhodobacter capsulatus]|uniref:GvpL/GvpF family gas vesicle protein n=1 Tax=Rhodobacter capsulatus TaxID=1061 RepID=UPI004027DCBB